MSITKTIGVYCHACEQMQDMNSLLFRDTLGTTGENMRVKCVRGHSYDYAQTVNFRKQTLPLIEKQPLGTITMPVWIHPEALQRLQERFPKTLQTNMCSFVQSLADGDSILVEGQYMREIRSLMGPKHAAITRGRDMVGVFKENALLRQTVDELEAKLAAKPASAGGGSIAGMAAMQEMMAKMAAKLGMDVTEVPVSAAAETPVIAETVQPVDPYADFRRITTGPKLPGGLPVPTPGK